MKENDLFKVEKHDHIAWLILNNPEKRNAMSLAFYRGLIENFSNLDKDPDVRVVIIKAEGKSFTAGTDLEEAASLGGEGGADDRERLNRVLIDLQEGVNAIENCRKPVIAAIHSHCLGGGLDMVCACDIRIADKTAVFSIRETRIGLIADIGTLQRLPHIIGQGFTRELALTGRDFKAEEAFNIGFVTRVCHDRNELYKEAEKTASMIAGCPPLAVQGTKDVINFSRDHGVPAGLQYVAQKNITPLLSEDTTEAMTSFMKKRKPVFKGK